MGSTFPATSVPNVDKFRLLVDGELLALVSMGVKLTFSTVSLSCERCSERDSGSFKSKMLTVAEMGVASSFSELDKRL